MKKKTFVLQMIVIAAAYAVLTILQDKFFGMTKEILQIRIADALCVLPLFTPAAIPGVFIGCLIANSVILSPLAASYIATGMINAPVMDIFLGSFATLVGCTLSYLIRKKKFLVSIPPIITNTVTVSLLFKYAYRFEDSTISFLCKVGVGQIIAVGLLGSALLLALEDSWYKWFPKEGQTVKSKDEEFNQGIKGSDIVIDVPDDEDDEESEAK